MLARTDETDDDHIGQLIATAVSVAEALEQLVVIGNPERGKNLDRIAHRPEIKWLSHAGTQLQFVASSADIRRICNEQIASEDSKLVRVR